MVTPLDYLVFVADHGWMVRSRLPRRRQPRYLAPNLLVRFWSEKPSTQPCEMNEGFLTDASEGGVYVQTDRPPDMGTHLNLLISKDSKVISLSGEVAWVTEKPSRRGMGVMVEGSIEDRLLRWLLG